MTAFIFLLCLVTTKKKQKQKQKKVVTPSILHIMPHESLVSLMILYVRKTFIYQIVKYNC